MKLTFSKHPLKLKKTFRTSRAQCDYKENTLIRIQFINIVGFGEASPSQRHGDSYEKINSFFTNFDSEYYLGKNPVQIKEIMERLDEREISSMSSKAAVDMALYDIAGKMMEKPLYELLSIKPRPNMLVSRTISLGTEKEMLEETKLVMETEKPKILKLKLGTAINPDIVQKVHEISHTKIWVDINEGWQVDEAIDKMHFLQKFDYVEFVEQPIKAENPDGLEQIKRKCTIPIILDEDISCLADIKKYREIVDGINIKLMKCGGIYRAIEMITEARKRNLKLMLGCTLESSIAISAASHIAPLVDFIDLDSIILIEDDNYIGATIKEGKLNLSKGYGLGVKEKKFFH